jgi:hypothetical protein
MLVDDGKKEFLYLHANSDILRATALPEDFNAKQRIDIEDNEKVRILPTTNGRIDDLNFSGTVGRRLQRR